LGINARYLLLELLERPVGTLVDLLLGTGKVEGLDTTDTLLMSTAIVMLGDPG
jgi:hypothetical protein